MIPTSILKRQVSLSAEVCFVAAFLPQIRTILIERVRLVRMAVKTASTDQVGFLVVFFSLETIDLKTRSYD